MHSGQLLDLIRKRCSTRRFRPEPLAPEDTRKILEAARLAPSSCNTQPWHIVAVDDRTIIGELAGAAPAGTKVNRFIKDAGMIFVLCSTPHALVHRAASWIGRDCHRLDLGIAGEHMVLMATALGYGSCWIGWFSEEKVRRLVNVPAGVGIMALLAVGRPAAGPEPAGGLPVKRRKPLAEICSGNRFGQPAQFFSQGEDHEAD